MNFEPVRADTDQVAERSWKTARRRFACRTFAAMVTRVAYEFSGLAERCLLLPKNAYRIAI